MRWLFALTLFLGSALVFLVQPMYGKMVLPLLGGSPAAWVGCMVFFQAGLLAGYAYAHYAPARLGVRPHAVVHVAFFLAPILMAALVADSLEGWNLVHFPANPPTSERETQAGMVEPVFWLWQSLVLGIGLSFTMVAAGAPLLQKWFSRTQHGTQHALARDPYVLYVASNVGSMLALLAYPALVEPNFTLFEQGLIWSAGYLTLAGLIVLCAGMLWRPASRSTAKDEGGRMKDEKDSGAASDSSLIPHPSSFGKDAVSQPRHRSRLRWTVLALVPSSLLLSVTSYLTTDIAPMPLLWIIPLALYLLSFILVFARPHPPRSDKQLACLRKPPLPHEVFVRWMPLVVLVLVLIMLLEAAEPVLVVMLLHLGGFFWIAMVCHGALARSRPDPSRLTEFYLCLAAGGVLGGLFNALVAPLLFSSLVEYPLMLIVACLLRPGTDKRGERRGVSPTCFRAQKAGRRQKTKGSRQTAEDKWELWRALGRAPVMWSFTHHSPLTTHQLMWFFPFAGGTAALAGVCMYTGVKPGLLTSALIFGVPLLACYVLKDLSIGFGMGLAGVLLGGGWFPGAYGQTEYRTRSFFGVHRVTVDADRAYRYLVHGNTVHGEQSLDPDRQNEPLTYFTRTGPIGQVMDALKGDHRLERVALIGLGAGAMACYSQPGQEWTFFEIDPAVIYIARDSGLFTYLKKPNCRGNINIIAGDGRLALSRWGDARPQQKFGMLVVDAFSSDAIPVHLLTREAMQVYQSRLQPDGIMAFHVSNRFVDLEPVLANLARDADPTWTCVIQQDTEADKRMGKWASDWMVLTRRPEDVDKLNRSGRRLARLTWSPARPDPGMRTWTDDFSNLFSVLRVGKQAPKN